MSATLETATLETAVGASLDRIEGGGQGHGPGAVRLRVCDRGRAVCGRRLLDDRAGPGTSAIDEAAVLALPGVRAVLWHGNAPKLESVDDPELALFQSDRVAYRGQFVAGVVADSYEEAQAAAMALEVDYEVEEHHVVLDEDDPSLYTPEKVIADYPAESDGR